MKVIRRIAELPWSVVLGGVVVLVMVQAATLATVIEVYQHGWYDTLVGFKDTLRRLADDEAVLGVASVALIKYMANETAKSEDAKSSKGKEDQDVSNK